MRAGGSDHGQAAEAGRDSGLAGGEHQEETGEMKVKECMGFLAFCVIAEGWIVCGFIVGLDYGESRAEERCLSAIEQSKTH